MAEGSTASWVLSSLRLIRTEICLFHPLRIIDSGTQLRPRPWRRRCGTLKGNSVIALLKLFTHNISTELSRRTDIICDKIEAGSRSRSAASAFEIHGDTPKSCFALLLAIAWRIAYKPYALLIVWDIHMGFPVAVYTWTLQSSTATLFS